MDRKTGTTAKAVGKAEYADTGNWPEVGTHSRICLYKGQRGRDFSEADKSVAIQSPK